MLARKVQKVEGVDRTNFGPLQKETILTRALYLPIDRPYLETFMLEMSKPRVWRNDFICNHIVHKTSMVPDEFQGKGSVGFNAVSCNFVTNKLWLKSQDLSERLHPKSLCFVTRNLDFSCRIILGLWIRRAAVGRQIPCPPGDWWSPAESRMGAADGGSRGGNPAMSAASGSTMRGPSQEWEQLTTNSSGAGWGNRDERQPGTAAAEKYQD